MTLQLLQTSTIIELMDKKSVVQALAALAHPVRLDAFRALVVAGHEGLAQKTLAEVVGVGPTNLAFHLKELTAAGLVTQAQAGRFVIYRAAFKPMNDLLSFLTQNCCRGLPASPADPAAANASPGGCGY
jgi:ArsR family transcriptional regulator, arsenate/arsenite/antimonite-responsive transcriptional repressor